MSNNVIKLTPRPPSGPVVGEWRITMRMIFGGGDSFEFDDIPEMAMSDACVEDLVAAFRKAVEAKVKP